MTNSYDANGRLSGIADASRTYLSNLTYQGQSGSLSAMTLGNGIQQTFAYNDRLQMTQMVWTKDNTVIQRYDYSFGQVDPQTNNVDVTKNNGQLAQIESYIGGSPSSATKQFTQKFVNDSIGRLEKETETRGDTGSQVYQQKFSYDRFGNRYLKAAENPAGQNPLLPTPVEDNNIDRATNRFAANTGTIYDEAGNITTDTKYRGLKYSYDANGRMHKTSFVDDTNQSASVYDASGNRVATRVNDTWRFLIYDAFGKLISEYGGAQSTDEGGVKYILQNIQGSTRCVTSISGAVLARMDYQAFGEQIPSNIGQRTAQGFSVTDSIRNRYALTERDEATGLDDTWWRKLENRAGRWTSPDPYNGSMSLGNPQSFNRYSYVENQPTNFIDPSGLLKVQYCTRTWVDYGDGTGRHYSPWTCVTVYDDGGGDGPGAGENGGQANTIPDNCKKALRAIGLLRQTERRLNDPIIDVDPIQNRPASEYFGNDRTAGLTVGQYFDARTDPGGGFTYRAGRTAKGRAIGKTGTYRRGGDLGMGLGLRVHETAHRVQPKSSDLDVSLAKLLKVDTAGKTASKALTDYFNSGCNPKFLKK